ncbi:5651_t:CDS:2 [Racocetra persica]|uniref:5651_t:CDS:1 n=1 Tax=Racocetra persica TaxID=160502 RepID=A0ACA9LIS2_9GLOM|nr:5651_t:CDS:2 [Racocetra persica]
MHHNKNRIKTNELQEELADNNLEILALLSLHSSSSCSQSSQSEKPVDLSEDTDLCDIYIYYIMIEVFRSHHSKLNQEFVITVIDIMFDPTITTTSFTKTRSNINSSVEQESGAKDNNVEQYFNKYKSDSDCYPKLSLSSTPSSTDINDRSC